MSEHVRTQLLEFRAGLIKPSALIGNGYRNPRKAAYEYLLKKLHNEENPSARVDGIIVSSTGQAFCTEVRAVRSQAYGSIMDGSSKLISSSMLITDYGVMPSPDGEGGYVIYIVTSKYN